tara:strand:+ start:443 stop:619 length:177 start_codon:yes stop_codon:yes gene_type:complete
MVQQGNKVVQGSYKLALNFSTLNNNKTQKNRQKKSLLRGILGNSAPLALGMRSVQGKV